MDLYCFNRKAGHVNSSACTFLDVFWSAGVGANCACDDVFHCLFFSTKARGVRAIYQPSFYQVIFSSSYSCPESVQCAPNRSCFIISGSQPAVLLVWFLLLVILSTSGCVDKMTCMIHKTFSGLEKRKLWSFFMHRVSWICSCFRSFPVRVCKSRSSY